MDGIITQATMWRLSSSCNGFPVTDQQIGNGQTPVGKGCNGCNGFNEVTEIEETTPLAFTSYGSESEKPPQTRSSSYCKGSAHYGPVTPCQDPLRPADSSVNVLAPGSPIKETSPALQGHDKIFWQLVEEHPDLIPFQIANKFCAATGVVISNNTAKQFVSRYRTKHLQESELPSMPLMNIDIATTYSWVSAASDGLHDVGITPNENYIYEVLCSWKKAPSISLQQIKDLIQSNPDVLKNTLDIKYW